LAKTKEDKDTFIFPLFGNEAKNFQQTQWPAMNTPQKEKYQPE
jgi:hypothetical protein